MLKFTLKCLMFAPACFGPLDWVARYTAPSTHTTIWNTCCHNTALLI